MKKFRDKRRYYRKMDQRVEQFEHHLNDVNSWYYMWHMHLDNWGKSRNTKERRIHVRHYIKLLKKIEASELTAALPFQTFVYLDGEDPTDDAFFIHTPNPNASFPVILPVEDWIIDERELPPLLRGLVDLDTMEVGRYGKNTYYIQIKNLGLRIK
ncbi:hypothetical protein [Paenibacillus sp. MMO-58]|uniref:hypothetical protein n=1 Tax=Paenibacillus sp. MMO-58 TaxID=3081290 RepID=UPI0030185C54